jgi:hypothetical protein
VKPQNIGDPMGCRRISFVNKRMVGVVQSGLFAGGISKIIGANASLGFSSLGHDSISINDLGEISGSCHTMCHEISKYFHIFVLQTLAWSVVFSLSSEEPKWTSQ